jgi:hypothetical protein
MELYIGIFIVLFLVLFPLVLLYLILTKKQQPVLQPQKPICLEDTLDKYIIHF